MMLEPNDGPILCEIAKAAVAAAVAGRGYVPDPATLSPALLEKRGCFVTLRTGGRLRGCLGCFESNEPLYLTVAEYARHSTLSDPRFANNRLRQDDLSELYVEISIISPPTPCRDPLAVRLGIDGIQVCKGMRCGVFLPQVATETGWNVEEFWGHCCRDKAGLDWDAWRGDDIERYTFTAEIVTC